MSVFVTSKDVQYLVLLNLLDFYVLLSLSIYSVVFKDNMAELYYESLLRCWVIFLMYQRRHYDKAPLISLSNIEYWKSIDHPLVSTLLSYACAFDEYPVENFHSVLRAHTHFSDPLLHGDWSVRLGENKPRSVLNHLPAMVLLSRVKFPEDALLFRSV